MNLRVPMQVIAGLGATAALIAAGFAVYRSNTHRKTTPKLAYDASGYGGYVGGSPTTDGRPSSNPKSKIQNPKSRLVLATAAYNAGRYEEAEDLAAHVANAPPSRSPGVRELATDEELQAGLLRAYAAARRNDLKTARVRFAEVEKAAASTNPKSKIQNPKSTAADAAYQHAVCTAALGDKVGAEKEYLAFMRRYPESELVHAAYRRIEKLHGGKKVPEAEAAWTEARKIADSRRKERERKDAMCGPAVLAEILRRREPTQSKIQTPKSKIIEELAREMKTDENGTTLAALADACGRRGIQTEALSLTEKGLEKQPCPLVALLFPAHYVLVEQVAPDGIAIWDPNVGSTRLPRADWSRKWQGVALTIR